MGGDVDATAQRAPLLILGSLGIVSTLICASAVVLVFAYGLYKKLVYRLALYQVLGSLMHSVLLTLQLAFLKYGNGPLCLAVAYLYNSSHWIKLLALTWVTFHLFLYAVCYKNCKKLEIPLGVALVIIPFAISAVSFGTRSYGQTPPLWCWIFQYNSTDSAGLVNRLGMQLILWLIPATALLVVATVVVVLTVSVLFTRIYRELRSDNIVAMGPRKRALKQMCPLMAYPVAFVVLLLFPLTFAVLGDIDPKSSALSTLTYLTAVSIPLWSISSGVTLLVVILCYRYAGRTGKRKARPRPQNVAYGAMNLNPPAVQP
eukprot:Em0003g1003a